MFYYAAFGELFVSGGTTANPYLFAGQRYDALTGRYYLIAQMPRGRPVNSLASPR